MSLLYYHVSFGGKKKNEDAKKAPFIDFLLNASYKLHLSPAFIYSRPNFPSQS